MSAVVLITGCSSGIGRDLARRLTHAGYSVAATARKPETMADLPVALRLPLDVTQSGSVQNAVDCTMERFGRIDVLVNNAGYSVFGAAEEISEQQMHGMFDVNVYGMMRTVRAVAPVMRAQHSGRIINISSIVGKLATPVNGAYAASKFAVEALSDALRLELEPFGVQIVVVEPGSINTNFADEARSRAQDIFQNPSSPYRLLYQQFNKVNDGMRKNEAGPETVSRIIQRVIETPHPKARYTAGIGISGRVVMGLRDWVWDRVVRRMFEMTSPVM